MPEATQCLPSANLKSWRIRGFMVSTSSFLFRLLMVILLCNFDWRSGHPDRRQMHVYKNGKSWRAWEACASDSAVFWSCTVFYSIACSSIGYCDTSALSSRHSSPFIAAAVPWPLNGLWTLLAGEFQCAAAVSRFPFIDTIVSTNLNSDSAMQVFPLHWWLWTVNVDPWTFFMLCQECWPCRRKTHHGTPSASHGDSLPVAIMVFLCFSSPAAYRLQQDCHCHTGSLALTAGNDTILMIQYHSWASMQVASKNVMSTDALLHQQDIFTSYSAHFLQQQTGA